MTRARALAALACTLAALVLSACGDAAATGSGDLRWDEVPAVFTPETLPDDRIATGSIRNDSLREIELAARDLKVLDSDGDEVPAAAIFNEGFGRSYYDPSRGPLPEPERVRIGREAKLKPGDAVPLTVSWTEAAGGAPAEVVDYGGGSLPLP